METQNTPLSFRLVKIITDQFATFDDVINTHSNIEVITDASFAANIEFRTILCKTSHSFKNESGHPFIKIGISCIFDVEENDWKKLYSIDNTSLNLPRDLCIHITMITIGTARGVLHAKTEGSPYNINVLPTINTLDLIPSDITINFTPDNHGQTS